MKKKKSSKPKEVIIEIAKSAYSKFTHGIRSDNLIVSQKTADILKNYNAMSGTSSPTPITGQPIAKSFFAAMDEQYNRIRESMPPKELMGTRKAAGIYDYKDFNVDYKRIGGSRNPEFEYEDVQICRVPAKEYMRSMFEGTKIQQESFRNAIDNMPETHYKHIATGKITNEALVNNIATFIQTSIYEVFEEHPMNRTNLPLVMKMIPHMLGYVSVKASYMLDGTDLSNIMERIHFQRDDLKHNALAKIYAVMSHNHRAIHEYASWWRRTFLNPHDTYGAYNDLLFCSMDTLFDSHFTNELYDMRTNIRRELEYTIGANVIDPMIQYLIRNTVDFNMSLLKHIAPQEAQDKSPYLHLIKDSNNEMFRKRLEIAAVIADRIEYIVYNKQRPRSVPGGVYGSISASIFDDSEDQNDYMKLQLEDNGLYDGDKYISYLDIMHRQDFKALYRDIKDGRCNYETERYYMEDGVNNKVKDKEVPSGSFLDLLNCYNKSDISILLEYESSYDGLKEVYDDKIGEYLSTVPHKAINHMRSQGSYNQDTKSLLDIMSEPTVRLLNSAMIDRSKAYWFIPATRQIYSEMKNCKSGSRYVWLEGLNEFIQERFGIDTTWVNSNGDLLLLEKLSPTRLKSIKKTIEFNINKLTLKVAMKLDDKRLRHLLNVAELKLSYVNQILPNAERKESEVVASITGKREVSWGRK